MRRYHIVVIVERTGQKVYMTCAPLTHKEACTMMRKFTAHTFRRILLEEVT